MLDDLMDGRLIGLTREQIVDLLGPPDGSDPAGS